MSFRLLIFVPAQTDAIGIHHELTARLAECLSGEADVTLAISSDKSAAAKVTEYDIVHIFGCWSHSAMLLAHKAYMAHVPYVVTPLGGLQPWEMRQHERSLLAKQQQKLIRQASAVHVCGKLESETFAKLEWNDKTCTIKNPVLTSQITFRQAADSLVRLYRKVFDSNARLLLSDDARSIIGDLMQLGLDPHAFDLHEHTAEVRQQLQAFTPEDWRRTAIYAADERIVGLLKRALDGLNIAYPATDVGAIDRFDADRGYVAGPLRDDALLSRNILLRNKLKDLAPEYGSVERKICIALLNLHYEIGRHTAPLLHLGNLYTMFRFTDMDEDAVMDLTGQLKISDFADAAMGVMRDFLHLTEGFMLFSPEKRKSASRLYKDITKFGTYA